jgi:hypothetical protein
MSKSDIIPRFSAIEWSQKNLYRSSDGGVDVCPGGTDAGRSFQGQ